MRFILAQPEHEAQLRAMVRAESMPGRIQVTYAREPDFFHGLGIQGTFNQIVAAEENRQIIGFGCRSIRPMWINGKETNFGYLSGLRSSPDAKRRLGLARGYRTFRELHADGRCPGYISTIIEGNSEAVSTIASGRGRLPHYNDLGKCFTYALALKRRENGKPHPDIKTRSLRVGEEALAANTLRKFGQQYQFFPAFNATDFDTALLRDLPVNRFLIAETDDGPCGIAAIWDQSAFKQHRIHAYSPGIRRLKPLINLGLKSAGFNPLPTVGETLHHAYFCFAAVKDNDPRIMRALINSARAQSAQSGFSHLLSGFHEKDPAARAVHGMPKSVYRSQLFFVGWEQERHTFAQLDDRIPHFDPAIL
ncbi:MAG: hypothetical protein GXY61_13860 [Lentisphaerae bacterium]|nr:hypothetical protein [Lentisphaerota bacterium]